MTLPAIARSRILACPLCGEVLADPEEQGKRFRCSGYHSFDIARQGYIHLLPVQHKKSRAPGDDKAMVQSRKAFLGAGYYEPLAKTLTRLLQENLPQRSPQQILDAGCGEGYYTQYLQQHGSQSPLVVYGIDISKPAIISACQRSKEIAWMVASLKRPPLLPGCIDGVISVFSPLPDEAMVRCLADDGILVMVTPGNDHLKSLKKRLYDEVQPFDENKVLNQREACWDLVTREKLCYEFSLDSGEMIHALLAMTPHTWRIPPEKKAGLDRLTTLTCEADFLITVWRKTVLRKKIAEKPDE